MTNNSTPLKVVGIGGSLSDFSGSLYALNITLAEIKKQGHHTQTFDVGQLNLPLYDTRATVIPENAEVLCKAVFEADALVLASPLYHGTISGLFKNTIDWLELLSKYETKYFTNKVVGLISTAGGVQGLQAINTMEYIVRALRGWTLPYVVPISRAYQVFQENGKIVDPQVNKQLQVLGTELIKAAQQFQTVKVGIGNG